MCAADDIGTSTLYRKVAELPVEVAGYRTIRNERPVSSDFVRVTTTVELAGPGGDRAGRGEDVTYDAEDHDDYPAELDLAGQFTFTGLSRRLGELSAADGGRGLFGRPPLHDMSLAHRRWAFESAALDLALRQNGLSLGAALGLEYRPVRFVVSTRHDIEPWLELYPELEFKLDPTPEWDNALLERLAASGAVRVVDFKAFYRGTPVDMTPDPELYARVVRALPEAVVEDAGVTGETCGVLGASIERLSWDAPIHSWRDVEVMARVSGLELPRYLNIKPSRFGTVEALFDCVEHALEHGIVLYGGGQFELGPGREQIQVLAALLYPDGPNDVAPPGYNEPEPRPGLSTSPLSPPVSPAGFSFAD